MIRTKWTIPMSACLILFVALSALRAADPPVSDAASSPRDFQGKLVAITLMSDSEDLVLLSSVTEATLAGRQFLRGRGVNDGETPDWRNDATVLIPIDDVQQLVLFTDIKEYRRNINSRAERLDGKAASLQRTSRRLKIER